MTTASAPAPSDLRTNAGQWVVAALLLLLFLAFAWLQRVPSLTTANDDATYLLLSRSLRDGGYNSIHFVDAPAHTKYPPVFPALLAGVSAIAGESVDAFVAMNIALAAAGLALMFAVARRRLPAPVALGALGIAATSPFLQGTAGTVMSEPAFLALIALTLWLLARDPLSSSGIALACACAALAALTRTVGATLVLAVLAFLLLERRWRSAALYVGVVTLVVAAASLWLRGRGMPQLAADYITEATQRASAVTSHPVAIVARRVAVNTREYAGSLTWLLSVPTVRGTIVDNVLWVAVLLVGLVAGVVSFWRRWRMAALFALAYGALILIWPWAIGRFLVPMLPLLALAFLSGVYTLAGRWGPRAASLAVGALAAVMMVTGVSRSASRTAIRSRCDREQPLRSPSCFNPDQRSFFAAARYVGSETPPPTIIMSSKEATFFYLAQRRLIPADSITARPAADASELLRRRHVSYVVLNHVTLEDLAFAERLASACAHLEPVRHFPPRTTVFRVLPMPLPDSRACETLRNFRERAGQFAPQIF